MGMEEETVNVTFLGGWKRGWGGWCAGTHVEHTRRQGKAECRDGVGDVWPKAIAMAAEGAGMGRNT